MPRERGRARTPRSGAAGTGPGSAPNLKQVRSSDRARGAAHPAASLERRRASRSLWQACETLLSASADPRELGRALETLRVAFGCDGVALHARGPTGTIEPWCARGRWQTRPGDLRGCVSMPLLSNGERLGTLDLLGRPGQHWTPAQLGLIRTASGALGAALGARFELERLRHQPGRDPATGLPDDRAFTARLTEELSRARRHGLPIAVAYVELDHFAALRERYGPEVADGALAEASLVLKLALRDSDILARLSAGRFAALLPETQSTPAVRCADRLRRRLEDHRFARVGRVSATAAVATRPRDGLETVELLEAVGRALAVARKSGRRRVSASAPLHLQ